MTAIDPFANVRAGATNTTTTTAKTPEDQFGKDTFLKLLVAQLRYQNPLEPQDGSQFLAQTAQFTTVEKLTSLENEMKSSLTANLTLTAAALIGHEVKYADSNSEQHTGVVSGVKLTADGPLMHVGDIDVPLAAVLEVHDVPGSVNPTS
jgi:flagellar basal-body rod modification protein FlgD